jgi:ribosome maturation protein SDO1
MANITYDPEKFQLTIVRLRKNGSEYELVVDPDKAIAYREKKLSDADLVDVLKSDKIFSDAQKGLLAPQATFKSVFGTQNEDEITKQILTKGDLHLTAEYKRELREKVKKQIIQIIQANGVDPRTGHPHPLVRIESALTQVKYKVDEFVPAKDQVKGIVKMLQDVLPIRFEEKDFEVIVPAKFAAKVFGYLQHKTTVLRQDWLHDGSVKVLIRIPGGLELTFMDELLKQTVGTAQVTLKNSQNAL